MANIVLVTETTTHPSAVRTRDALVGGGHTVTLVAASASTAQSLAAYDLIVGVRTGIGATNSAKIGDAFRMGVPVLISEIAGTASGISTNGPVVACRLASGVGTESAINTFYAVGNSTLWTDVGVNTPANVTPYASSDYGFYIQPSAIAPGASTLALNSSSDTGIKIAYAKAGAIDTQGGQFPADIAFCGFMYAGNTTYSATGEAILLGLVSMLSAAAPSYVISGAVKDASGSPVSRVVRAHARSDGAVVAQTVSSGTTGGYSLSLPNGDAYTVVCLDAAESMKNALVYDWVTPVVS